MFFYKLSTNYIKSKMLHVTIMCIALAIGEQICRMDVLNTVRIEYKYNTVTITVELHFEIHLYYCVDRGVGSDWRAGSDQETWSSVLSTLHNTSFQHFQPCHKLDLLQMTLVGSLELVRLTASCWRTKILCLFNCPAAFEQPNKNVTANWNNIMYDNKKFD